MALPRHTRDQVTEKMRHDVFVRYGLDLSLDFTNDILNGNPDLLEDMRAMNVDTDNRSWFLGEVSEKIGCGRWPRGDATDEQWEAFKAQLRINLPHHGQRYAEVDDRPASVWS